MSEQKREWVPGFIWVTPFKMWRDDPRADYRPVPDEPLLVNIESIKQMYSLVIDTPERKVPKSGIALVGDDSLEVCETLQELAELIRNDRRNSGGIVYENGK